MRKVFVLIVVITTLSFVFGANTMNAKLSVANGKLQASGRAGNIQASNGARLNSAAAGPTRSKRSVSKVNANLKSQTAKVKNAHAKLNGGHGNSYGYNSYESYCDPYDPYCDSYSYSYESYYCDPYDPYCDSYEYYKKK
jgi:hypothetical protein